MLLKKIVVAEDDDTIAHMVSMAMGDAGYLCLRAHDGAEALKLCRVHTPNLLVLDIMMPHVDGLEVARTLKADVISSKTPILMLTAMGGVDNTIEGLDAGADDYLAKPFDMRELSARIKALIRTSRRERERNPTTDLPGSGAIEEHIEALIGGEGGATAAVLHFDVHGFDVYADEVGFARAQTMVVALGKLILNQTRAHGDGGAFVGHLGGVNFIAVATADDAESLAKEVVAGFVAERGSWTAGPEGEEHGTAMHLACSVVTTDVLTGTTTAEKGNALAEHLAEGLRRSKQNSESNYVVWKPETA